MLLILLFFSAITIDSLASLSRMEVCFSESKNSPINIVFPSQGSLDCFCPVVFLEQECYSLRDCSCFNSTAFNRLAVDVCLKEEGMYVLRAQNLTRDINNSVLHIYHGYYCKEVYIPPYRVYTHSFRIKVGKNQQ